ncbi:class I SAM-dependent methyltransferase [Caulobacter sp. S45]|uniref:class I SAM-dependent methyltransferase n=1 Tax=Caulobacter sp. S45 TaxID=1641861 RepID=UPI00131B36B4|nr:class I SAM-dependent methyltransferase [Caulobacter sp. S45]
MDVAEFDQFADEYTATHAANIRMSGEDPEYFARYKIEEVRRRWTETGRAEPRAIMDFGAGIGNSLPHLARLFPGAALTGLDVSEKSLAVADRRFSGIATLVPYDGVEIPLPAQSFDLIFSACVFHHIDAAEHAAIFAQLRRLLRPGGLMAIFEHNPVNPATRHIVATCPFDANAVLLSSGELKRSQAAAGFDRIEVAYTGFFPGALRSLRPLERYMARLPIGAQYYTLAHA